MNRYRSHTCGELRAEHAGADVRLSGFLSARRDHRHLLFLHLRDFHGTTQVVVEADALGEEVVEQVRRLPLESVVTVNGDVRERPADQLNPELETGEVEVVCRGLDVLSPAAETLPMLVEKGALPSEDVRLRYRYIDLRRAPMRDMLVKRNHMAQVVRSVFGARGFLEVHTPILSNSSPEGARDFLVPSRLHPGRFFALPQAPQQWKQLLMASGVDRYFQIAPCFRDEPARADRSPGEFYQIDIEMAFVEQEDVLTEVEAAMLEIAAQCTDKRVLSPFPRISYRDSLERFGSDKPDLRFGLELWTLSDLFVESSVQFLRDAVATGGAVRGFVVPGGAAHFARKDLDALQALARESGVKGLAWLFWTADGLKGSMAGATEAGEAERLRAHLGAGEGDLLLICAGPRDRIDVALNAVRLAVGTKLGLRDPDVLHFVWITDFPMFERDPDTGDVVFSHNPFSMPEGGLEALNTRDPLEIRALQYDLVCNGTEISSGAIRNNEPDTMYRAFEIAGHPRSVVDTQFGHMVAAFRNSCPPHGGIAPGFERLLMMFTGETSLRELVPFPKNQSCQDVLVGSPSEVGKDQLSELFLEVTYVPKDADTAAPEDA